MLSLAFQRVGCLSSNRYGKATERQPRSNANNFGGSNSGDFPARNGTPSSFPSNTNLRTGGVCRRGVGPTDVCEGPLARRCCPLSQMGPRRRARHDPPRGPRSQPASLPACATRASPRWPSADASPRASGNESARTRRSTRTTRLRAAFFSQSRTVRVGDVRAWRWNPASSAHRGQEFAQEGSFAALGMPQKTDEAEGASVGGCDPPP